MKGPLYQAALLAAILGVPAVAQTDHDSNGHGWYMFFGDHALREGSRWGIHTEAQWRRADVISSWQQLLLRPAVNYSLSPRVVITGGYGYIRTYRYGEFPTAATFPEHRLFEQVLIRQSPGRWQVQHRLRLEQRWIRPDGADTRYQNRFRYFLKGTTPIGGRWFLALYDEPFLGFGKNRGASVFDQNRAYAAVGRKLGEKNSVEFGYLYQLVKQRNGRVFEHNHTFQLALFSTVPLNRLFRR